MSKDYFDPTVATWVVHALATIVGWVAILEGLVITFGAHERLEEGIFETALKIPGSPPTWGIGILLIGIAIIVGLMFKLQTITSYAMIVGTVWSVSLVTSFAINVFTQDNSDLTGIVMYAFLALIFAVLGAVYRDSAKSVRRKKI